MLRATAIRMREESKNDNDTKEIDCIYLEASTMPIGWLKKEAIHDFLKLNPEANIYVDILPRQALEPVETTTEKYVRSAANDNPNDNLLNLPAF